MKVYQRVSSETDDVTAHGMQKISHVTMTLFQSGAVKGQKKRKGPAPYGSVRLQHLLIIASVIFFLAKYEIY